MGLLQLRQFGNARHSLSRRMNRFQRGRRVEKGQTAFRTTRWRI